MKLWRGAGVMLCLCAMQPAVGSEFEEPAEWRSLSDVPVRFEIPESLRGERFLQVEQVGVDRVLPAQQISAQEAVFILPAASATPDRPRRFLVTTANTAHAPRVRIENDQGKITFRTGDRDVVTYHAVAALPPEGVDRHFQRSGHLHPFRTPAGRTVTDEFPEDHRHQHAIFGAWVNTEFEGRDVDFWNQGKGTGTVEHREILDSQDGPVFALLRVQLAYLDLNAPGGPRPAIFEEWTIRCYAIDRGSLFEIESLQTSAGESPLTIRKYRYGGMAVRGTSDWIAPPGHQILTSQGKALSEGNHTRADWVSMFGQVDGETCSVTAFSHPGNFRSPQPVRLHPQKPYFVFAPEVLEEFQISPSASLTARYLFLAEDAAPEPDHLQRIFTAWSR